MYCILSNALLYHALSDHGIDNLLEAGDVGACHIVTFLAILLGCIIDSMIDTFKSLEDVCEFVLEDVMETSLFVFFELLSVPGGSHYSNGGGGGGNNDLPHKKKDDDDELLRARRIAKAIAMSCPRKTVRRGYRR